MESKTWFKFSHIIVFFLLATCFETLMARKESDGEQVIQLLKESTSLDDLKLMCEGKLRWPELLGVPAEMAEKIIKKENPFIQDVQIILAGSPVTADFSCGRVRISVNIMGVGVSMPVVG